MARVPAQYVVIVDGYSSGALLAPAFRKKGFQVLHIQTTDPIPSIYRSSFFRENFDGNLVSTGNVDAILETLSAFSPLAVVPGAESGVELADELSEKMGLLTNGTELSLTRRDKFEMGERLRKCGVPCVHQILVTNQAIVNDYSHLLGDWPIVVKPQKSAGTDSVRICHSEAQVNKAIELVFETKNIFGTENNAAVVQEYLSGIEYAVNLVSRSGTHVVTDIWAYSRHVGKDAGTIYDEDWLMPAKGQIQNELIAYAYRVLDALGVRHGPSHLEVKMTSRGPILVEMGARLCGANLPRLVTEATGQSQVELTVAAYTGQLSGFEKTYQLKKQAAVVFLQGQGLGQMCYRWIPTLRSLPSVDRVLMHYDDGQELPRTVDSASVCGTVDLIAEDEASIREAVATIRKWEKQGKFETLLKEEVSSELSDAGQMKRKGEKQLRVSGQ